MYARLSTSGINLRTLRDCMIAPITEEWCFRCCMVPLLWLAGRMDGVCRCMSSAISTTKHDLVTHMPPATVNLHKTIMRLLLWLPTD